MDELNVAALRKRVVAYQVAAAATGPSSREALTLREEVLAARKELLLAAGTPYTAYDGPIDASLVAAVRSAVLDTGASGGALVAPRAPASDDGGGPTVAVLRSLIAQASPASARVLSAALAAREQADRVQAHLHAAVHAGPSSAAASAPATPRRADSATVQRCLQFVAPAGDARPPSPVAAVAASLEAAASRVSSHAAAPAPARQPLPPAPLPRETRDSLVMRLLEERRAQRQALASAATQPSLAAASGAAGGASSHASLALGIDNEERLLGYASIPAAAPPSGSGLLDSAHAQEAPGFGAAATDDTLLGSGPSRWRPYAAYSEDEWAATGPQRTHASASQPSTAATGSLVHFTGAHWSGDVSYYAVDARDAAAVMNDGPRFDELDVGASLVDERDEAAPRSLHWAHAAPRGSIDDGYAALGTGVWPYDTSGVDDAYGAAHDLHAPSAPLDAAADAAQFDVAPASSDAASGQASALTEQFDTMTLQLRSAHAAPAAATPPSASLPSHIPVLSPRQPLPTASQRTAAAPWLSPRFGAIDSAHEDAANADDAMNITGATTAATGAPRQQRAQQSASITAGGTASSWPKSPQNAPLVDRDEEPMQQWHGAASASASPTDHDAGPHQRSESLSHTVAVHPRLVRSTAIEVRVQRPPIVVSVPGGSRNPQALAAQRVRAHRAQEREAGAVGGDATMRADRLRHLREQSRTRAQQAAGSAALPDGGSNRSDHRRTSVASSAYPTPSEIWDELGGDHHNGDVHGAARASGARCSSSSHPDLRATRGRAPAPTATAGRAESAGHRATSGGARSRQHVDDAAAAQEAQRRAAQRAAERKAAFRAREAEREAAAAAEQAAKWQARDERIQAFLRRQRVLDSLATTSTSAPVSSTASSGATAVERHTPGRGGDAYAVFDAFDATAPADADTLAAPATGASSVPAALPAWGAAAADPAAGGDAVQDRAHADAVTASIVSRLRDALVVPRRKAGSSRAPTAGDAPVPVLQDATGRATNVAHAQGKLPPVRGGAAPISPPGLYSKLDASTVDPVVLLDKIAEQAGPLARKVSSAPRGTAHPAAPASATHPPLVSAAARAPHAPRAAAAAAHTGKAGTPPLARRGQQQHQHSPGAASPDLLSFVVMDTTVVPPPTTARTPSKAPPTSAAAAAAAASAVSQLARVMMASPQALEALPSVSSFIACENLAAELASTSPPRADVPVVAEAASGNSDDHGAADASNFFADLTRSYFA